MSLRGKLEDCKPYAWWQKDALRHVRKHCDPAKNARSVYLALVEIASNEQSNDFTATLEYIGNLSHMTNRKRIGDAIEQLEFYGLIEVSRSKLRMASAFKLLRFEGKQTEGSTVVTNRNNEDTDSNNVVKSRD